MAVQESSGYWEKHGGAHHPAAFYTPSSAAMPQLSSAVTMPEHPQVKYGDQSDGWIALILIVVFFLCLMDWLWRNKD